MLLALLLLLSLLTAVWWVLGGNVRVLLGGDLIRTGQLSPARLERLLTRWEVRTVVTLRGEDQEGRWFLEESELCRRMGVAYLPITMSAHLLPPVRAVHTLVHLQERGNRPIVIHCLGGKDRTGFASTLFLVLEGRPLEEALQQLSLLTFHLCDRETCPLHGFFDLYRSWLTETGRNHSVGLFRTWCLTVYCPQPYDADVEVLSFPKEATAGSEAGAKVRVTNRSSEPWVLREEHARGIRFGIRVLGPLERLPAREEEEEEIYFHRHRFEARDLLRVGMEDGVWAPGETKELTFAFRMPETAGRYLYRLDMVDEGVTWFYVRGYPANYREVTITP